MARHSRYNRAARMFVEASNKKGRERRRIAAAAGPGLPGGRRGPGGWRRRLRRDPYDDLDEIEQQMSLARAAILMGEDQFAILERILQGEDAKTLYDDGVRSDDIDDLYGDLDYANALTPELERLLSINDDLEELELEADEVKYQGRVGARDAEQTAFMGRNFYR